VSEERAKRKLSAILSADVKGYSRLMQEHELFTIRTLEDYRALMAEIIRKYRGRVVDSPGDNMLAEFVSVVDAVESAVEVQKNLEAKNAELPANRRMEFRIGINLGDVVVEGERIYGDGVNIAARIEGLAEGGGICISRTAYGQVKNKLNLGYEYLGEHSVKNIAEPVRVYRVLMEPEAAGKVIGEVRPKTKQLRGAAIGAVAVVIIIAGALAIWNFYLRPASVERMAFPLPDKPSIAVLPFDNLSGDPNQEYFSDGMTDDLITDLSKMAGLFVIARNSTFAYKGKAFDVRQISKDLGVRYVLEGSVRRAGEKVRINAQLIDASTGGHLWAERYDVILTDIFELQDMITQKILSALAVKLTPTEQNQISRKDTDSVEAYDAFLQGWAHYIRFTPDDFSKAVHYFKTAIEHDPNYPRAYAALASIYWESFYRFWYSSLEVSWREAQKRAEENLKTAMKHPAPLAYLVTSKIQIGSFEHEKAITTAERAIALDPNDVNSYLAMAHALIYDGRPKEALGFINKAMRLDPHYPAYNLFVLGLAHFGLDDFKEAANSFERALSRNPENYVALIPLAAAYAHLQREQDAAAAVEKLRNLLPTISVELVRNCPLWRYKNPTDRARLLDGLKKTKLPKSLYETLRKGV
jgi:TolB-like protein/class 3 adenylate cyclase